MTSPSVLLVLALVLLCRAGSGLGHDVLDPATHHAAPAANSTKLVGRESKLLGLDAYVSGSPSRSDAVIMISDVFGWKATLFRKLADKIAAHGYYVVAPDYFRGDPLVNVTDFPNWIIRHPPTASVGITKKLVKVLRKGIRSRRSVGLAGFCWGGKVAVLVGKQKGSVDAIVQCHPAFASASDYADVAVPISILAAPSDGVGNFTELLERRRREDHLKYYLKIFSGVAHGFTIRYDVHNKTAVAKANQAHRLLLKWFHKYL